MRANSATRDTRATEPGQERSSTTITVVLACHNRREKTLACLRAVAAQSLDASVACSVVLLDDGSTDGTVQAVRGEFPAVRIIVGNGDLFWCRGMHVALREATRSRPDFLLWINDDTLLYDDALARMLATSDGLAQTGLVVGSTVDPTDGRPTYGGMVRAGHGSFSFTLLEPDAQRPLRCDTINGNCVLVPRLVYERIGNLDPRFVHAMGDFDYGLRTRRHGFGVWICPGAIGSCARNALTRTWRDSSLGLRERLRKVMHLKGLPPSQWVHMTVRHGGLLGPVHFLAPYAKVLWQAIAQERV